ncbi:MAG: lysostaphin resistance A-like protein [Acidimicrobiales bacterium]
MPEPDLASRSALDGASLVPPRWGIGDAIIGWVLAQVGGAITASVVLGLSDREFDDLSLGWVAAAQVGLWLGFFVVPVVATRLKGNGIVEDLGLRATSWDGPVGVAIGVATQIVLLPLVYLPILFLLDRDGDDLSAPARELTDRASDPFGVTMLILIVGIGAPIFEEIFYRGLMQRALQRRLGDWPAVVVTAVVFGLSHFQLLQMPGLILFGMVVGVLALRTGRLGPSIAAHVGFNLVSVGLLLATG